VKVATIQYNRQKPEGNNIDKKGMTDMKKYATIQWAIVGVMALIFLLGLFNVFDSDKIVLPVMALSCFCITFSLRKRTVMVKVLQVILIVLFLVGLYSVFFDTFLSQSKDLLDMSFLLLMITGIIVVVSEIKIAKPEPTNPKK